MVRFGAGAAILISMFFGLVLLLLLHISDIISLILTGFVATYLTTPEEKNYKVGGIAAALIGILIFLGGFFTPPAVPYSLPGILNIDMISMRLEGIVTLVMGLVITILIGAILGSIGGFIAQKIFFEKYFIE